MNGEYRDIVSAGWRWRRILETVTPATVGITRIGSTSAPRLAAKPIIDIVVTVENVTAEEDYVDPLLAVGYRLRVREPGHCRVRTATRDLHVHVFERRDPAVDSYLLRTAIKTGPRAVSECEDSIGTALKMAWEVPVPASQQASST